MAEPSTVQKTVYHVEHGPAVMYTIDAHTAVANHPEEWSFEPWGNEPNERVERVKAAGGRAEAEKKRLADAPPPEKKPAGVKAAEDLGLKRRTPEPDLHPQAVIPNDWRSQPPASRRALAQQLGAPPNVSLADADSTIQEEVALRDAETQG